MSTRRIKECVHCGRRGVDHGGRNWMSKDPAFPDSPDRCASGRACVRRIRRGARLAAAGTLGMSPWETQSKQTPAAGRNTPDSAGMP